MTYEEIKDLFASTSLSSETITKIAEDFGFDGKKELFASLMSNPNIPSNVYFDHIREGSNYGRNATDNISFELWLLEDPDLYNQLSEETWSNLLRSNFDKWSKILLSEEVCPNKPFMKMSCFFKDVSLLTTDVMEKLIDLYSFSSFQAEQLLESEQLTEEIFDKLFKKYIDKSNGYFREKAIEHKFIKKAQLVHIISTTPEESTVINSAKIRFFNLFVKLEIE